MTTMHSSQKCSSENCMVSSRILTGKGVCCLAIEYRRSGWVDGGEKEHSNHIKAVRTQTCIAYDVLQSDHIKMYLARRCLLAAGQQPGFHQLRYYNPGILRCYNQRVPLFTIGRISLRIDVMRASNSIFPDCCMMNRVSKSPSLKWFT